ncbi:hypothetical protein F4780DRAFT_615877 [Xylariomycetidae sp. FL0641]|nr:hypothetical protein F4780DRAFT_615877 [Xylariomycetidae sp. FL0641]
MSSVAMGVNNPQKHRACDECRTRKLACSKEADGCARCKREGIVCHYSPQKQMGRPRKRPREESNDEDTSGPASTSKSPMTEIPPDTAEPGIDFIDMLLGNSNNPYGSKQQLDAYGPAPSAPGPAWSFCNPEDRLPEVNYDSVSTEHLQSFSAANIDPALFISRTGETPAAGNVPSLSPGSAGTPESHNGTYSPPAAAPSCACTASLYLALESMRQISEDVEAAVRQARLAAKTAYDVVNCPTCSFRLDPPATTTTTTTTTTTPQMIHGFQNLMLLATVIPSVAHAYGRILQLVDREAQRAAAERRRLLFRLRGLGGVWGGLDGGGGGGGGEDRCGAQQAFGHREMEPAMWRLTVRALLKLDVYGVPDGGAGCGGGGAAADPFHLGLRDIVVLMDNRSKARHAFLDAMVAAGAWPRAACGAAAPDAPGEQPTCQKIIAIARSSVDQLVIP